MRERLYTSNVVLTTKVSAAATNTVLATAKLERLGLSIQNDSGGANLKVKLGTPAAADDYGILLEPGATYEVPFGYIGVVTGIWDSASGAARVMEFI